MQHVRVRYHQRSIEAIRHHRIYLLVVLAICENGFRDFSLSDFNLGFRVIMIVIIMNSASLPSTTLNQTRSFLSFANMSSCLVLALPNRSAASHFLLCSTATAYCSQDRAHDCIEFCLIVGLVQVQSDEWLVIGSTSICVSFVAVRQKITIPARKTVDKLF